LVLDIAERCDCADGSRIRYAPQEERLLRGLRGLMDVRFQALNIVLE
jgi:hypothetical protein